MPSWNLKMPTKMRIVLFCATSLIVLNISQAAFTAIDGGKSGNGRTTRYWDCCKPACAWRENTNTTSPVRTCLRDGKTVVDPSVSSGCDGGRAYMCSNQQAFAANDSLAFGFGAASFVGGTDTSLCCACMLLAFQGNLIGKQMVLQVTNTGADLDNNHFDLAMPGSGVGLFTNGCSSQWCGSPSSGWGNQYGGVETVEECNNLPVDLQPGCKFRFEWFQGIANPDVNFYQITCPDEITSLSNCF